MQEGRELFETIVSSIKELPKCSGEEARLKLLSRILSDLHSLKGSARAVNESELTSICQGLETAFSEMRKVSPDHFAGAFSTIDLFNEITAMVEEFLDPQGGLEGKGLSQVEKEGLKASSYLKLEEIFKTLRELSPPAKPKEIKKREAAAEQLETGTFKAVDIKSKAGQEEAKVMSTASGTGTVRIPMERLDGLLLESEELLLLKAQDADRLSKIAELKALSLQLKKGQSSAAGELCEKIGQLHKQMVKEAGSAEVMINRFLDAAKTLTMMPMATVVEVLPRLVRELAKELGKDVEFSVSGSDLEVDRRILERLKDPLIHLVRNALDHGIETPELRERHGKQRRAKLELHIKQVGAEIEITVTDDGGGVSAELVKKKAVERGMISPGESKYMSYEQTLSLIFRPDFSTRDKVTEVSGRGLGLAIVKEKIEELSGRLEIHSTESKNTTFKITLPTKLSAFRGILVKAAGQTFVLPVSGLVKAVKVHPLALEVVDGRQTYLVNGKVIAVAHLARSLGLKEVKEQSTAFKYLQMLVVSSREKTAGVIVDQVLDQREFLVKKLGYPFSQLENFAGATVLPSGQVALVLRVHDLIEATNKTKYDGGALLSTLDRQFDQAPEAQQPQGKKLVLVVEDSITSRILLKNILESAGYAVRATANGEEALKIAAETVVSVIISDVEMPVMDGFALTKAIKADNKLKNIPVILVTSLSKEEDRISGLECGADGYFIKGHLDQTGLLEMVARLS